MDEFKKYINQHRQKLDTDEPSDHLFHSIERRLSSPKATVIPMVMKWAVAACIILLAGVGIYMFGFKSNDGQEISKTETQDKIDSSQIRKPLENKTIFQ